MLKPTHVSFEYLSDKRVNFIFAGLVDTGRVRYVPSHDKILVVLGLVRREFRRRLGVLMIGSPGMGWEFRRLAL